VGGGGGKLFYPSLGRLVFLPFIHPPPLTKNLDRTGQEQVEVIYLDRESCIVNKVYFWSQECTFARPPINAEKMPALTAGCVQIRM